MSESRIENNKEIEMKSSEYKQYNEQYNENNLN